MQVERGASSGHIVVGECGGRVAEHVVAAGSQPGRRSAGRDLREPVSEHEAATAAGEFGRIAPGLWCGTRCRMSAIRRAPAAGRGTGRVLGLGPGDEEHSASRHDRVNRRASRRSRSGASAKSKRPIASSSRAIVGGAVAECVGVDVEPDRAQRVRRSGCDRRSAPVPVTMPARSSSAAVIR